MTVLTVESVDSNGSYTVKRDGKFVKLFYSVAIARQQLILTFLRRNLRRFLQPQDRNYWSAKTAFVDPTVVPFCVPTFHLAASRHQSESREAQNRSSLFTTTWSTYLRWTERRVRTEWQRPLSGGIFHHVGKIRPGWWGWGVQAHPLSLFLPSRTQLKCTLQLKGHFQSFISTLYVQ